RHTIDSVNPHFLESVGGFRRGGSIADIQPRKVWTMDTPLVGTMMPYLNKAISDMPHSVKLQTSDLGVLSSMSTCDAMKQPVEPDGVQEDRLGDVLAPDVCHGRLSTDDHCSSSHQAGTGISPFPSLGVKSVLLKANQSYGRTGRVNGTLQKRRTYTSGFWMVMRLSHQYSGCTDGK
ncbi:hypothetical protein NEUTE2DRAFT_69739, partial [Neurospora tetrasperma FGSC 2509]